MLLLSDPDALLPLADGDVGLVQAVAGVFKLQAGGFWRALLAPDR